jgi:glycosyltransferase involved in cell wall biosynthesis
MEKIKKNTIVMWESLPNITGAQRVALNIAESLQDKFDFIFIVPSKGPFSNRLDELGIDVKYIPIGSYQRGGKGLRDIIQLLWYTPLSLWRARGFIKGADIIYANSTKVFIAGAILGAITNIPVLWHMHNLLSDRKSRVLIELFGKFSAVKKIIAVSHAAKNQFESLKEKTEVVYNGVDTLKFHADPGRGKVSNGKKKIAVIADLLPQKGHETLIRAIYKIKDNLPVQLMIVGSITDNNVSYEKELKRLVREFDLDNTIEFTGHRTDIPEILQSLDLLVVPSSSFEACSMVVLEAYACGVPVIGSDLGGTPELIDEGKTGYIFKATDEDDLAKKILLIINHPGSYSKIQSNCRKIAEERFDLKKSAKKIESIILQNT